MISDHQNEFSFRVKNWVWTKFAEPYHVNPEWVKVIRMSVCRSVRHLLEILFQRKFSRKFNIARASRTSLNYEFFIETHRVVLFNPFRLNFRLYTSEVSISLSFTQQALWGSPVRFHKRCSCSAYYEISQIRTKFEQKSANSFAHRKNLLSAQITTGNKRISWLGNDVIFIWPNAIFSSTPSPLA